MGFRSRVRHVNRGEPVSSSVTSRPTRDLEGQTNYLKNLVDNALLGANIGRDDIPLGSDVFIGAAIYFDSSDSTHHNALADVDADSVSGTVLPSEKSFVVGICVSKTNQTGRVISFGWIDVSGLESVMGLTDTGLYYLSSGDPGTVTLQRPAVGIPVLLYIGGGLALVSPQFRNLGEDHVHHSFLLEPGAAGDLVLNDGRFTINNANSSLRGWLPADHEVFNGAAPAGARFGYNLSAHQDVNQVWPPVPADAVQILWDPGEQPDGTKFKVETIIGQEHNLVRMDSNGIWWMTDCENDVPWTNLSIGSSSTSSSEGPCPVRSGQPILRLSFARISYATARRVVTSLTTPDNSPLSINDEEGNSASTGDLVIEFDGELMIDSEDSDVLGSMVLKEFSGTVFKQGRVTEGLVAGTGVTLNGSHTKTVTINSEEKTAHMGLVVVSAQVQPDERVLHLEKAFVNGAETDTYENVPFIALPSGRDSELVLSLKVPLDFLPDDPVVIMRTSFFVTSGGTTPQVTARYRVIPAGTSTPASIPVSDTSIDSGINGQSLSAFQYVSVDSDEIAVSAGDVLIIIFSRAGQSDGFDGQIGLLDLSAILTTAGA